MSKLDLNHLKKKYGKTGWSGGQYRGLVSKILEKNAEVIATQSLETNATKLKTIVKNSKDNKLKQLVTPPVKDIVTGDVILRKSADRGKIITNTLRDRILADMKSVLKDGKMVVPTGKNAGTVNNKLVVAMEEKLRGTFESYTKRNPKFGGVPSNVHTIAVTEVRSVVNGARDKYVREVVQANPTIRFVKEWIHNKGLSKEPRADHAALNGRVINMHELFLLSDGTRMAHPHDPTAPPEQVIGCNCELRYRLA